MFICLAPVGCDHLEAYRSVRGDGQPGAIHSLLHAASEVEEPGLEIADDGLPGIRGAADAVNPVRAGGVVFAAQLAEAVELVALELADRALFGVERPSRVDVIAQTDGDGRHGAFVQGLEEVG